MFWGAGAAQAAPAGALYLDGLYSITTVGVAVPFTASLTNDGSEPVSKIRLVIRVTATGLETQGMRLERRELDGTWVTVATRVGNKGDVRFVDDSYRDRAMAPGGALTGRYRITLLAGTPPGLAILSMTAEHRANAGWQTLANSPQYLTQVTSAAVDPSEVPSPAATVAAASSPGASAGPDMVGVTVTTGVSASQVLPSARARRISSRLLTLGGLGAAAMLLVTAVWVLRNQVDDEHHHSRQSRHDGGSRRGM
ncbi:MAG: hypothetical protein JXA67_01835 [Micromonosporaceae bacterium]|nr:hypothetical protein [Micromonosporaceae bacterium]